MRNFIFAGIASIILTPSFAYAEENCGLPGMHAADCDALRADLSKNFMHPLSNSSELSINKINIDSETIEFEIGGALSQVQLGTQNTKTLDQYLDREVGTFRAAEIWDLTDNPAPPDAAAIFERSRSEMNLSAVDGLGGAGMSERQILADQVAIRSMVPGVLEIEPTGREINDGFRSLAQYQVRTLEGDISFVHMRRSLVPSLPFDHFDDLPDGFEDFLPGNWPGPVMYPGVPREPYSGEDYAELDPATHCLIEAFDDPEIGCHPNAIGLISEGRTTLGSAVWIGAEYVLSSYHVGAVNWSAVHAFTGHDVKDESTTRDGELPTITPVRESIDGSIALVRHPKTGALTDLVVLKLQEPPVFIRKALNAPFILEVKPPPARVLASSFRDDLRDTSFYGVGYGQAGTALDRSGIKRRGTMRASCLRNIPGNASDCDNDPNFEGHADKMRLRHLASANGKLSWACDYDSGSPVYVQTGTPEKPELALVGILEGSVDDNITCAPESHFTDLTIGWVQDGIRNAIAELEGKEPGSELPAGVLGIVENAVLPISEPELVVTLPVPN